MGIPGGGTAQSQSGAVITADRNKITLESLRGMIDWAWTLSLLCLLQEKVY